MGDHTESIEIDFHPELISYEELLDVFWQNHNPLRESFYKGRQYMSLLLHRNEDQEAWALKMKRKWEQTLNGEIQTEMAPFSKFYAAEEYHQKYYLKRYTKAVEEVKSIFLSHSDFVNSTIAARLNGFVAGHGSLGSLKEEINEWGFHPEQTKELVALLNKLKW
jgi:peptide-methionine (S)-S-oxide reductase